MAVSYLCSAYQRLMVVDQLPLDFSNICLEIFQSYSVLDSNKFFDSYELSFTLEIVKSMEPKEVFLGAETKSCWNFKNSNITCFKCQQLGHYANSPACPPCISPSDQ